MLARYPSIIKFETGKYNTFPPEYFSFSDILKCLQHSQFIIEETK